MLFTLHSFDIICAPESPSCEIQNLKKTFRGEYCRAPYICKDFSPRQEHTWSNTHKLIRVGGAPCVHSISDTISVLPVKLSIRTVVDVPAKKRANLLRLDLRPRHV
jgi:hypothetical protein